jgi:hypothetical protein
VISPAILESVTFEPPEDVLCEGGLARAGGPEDADVLCGERVQRRREVVDGPVSVRHVARNERRFERTRVSDHASVMFSSV